MPHSDRPRHVLRLDEEATWPADLRQALDASVEPLRSFERVREHLDGEAQRDVMARIRPRANPHERHRLQVLASMAATLQSCSLVGYHCTRLVEDEIDIIRSEGLRPLTVELARQRVQRQMASGRISREIAAKLLARATAEDSEFGADRTGMTWLCFTTALLKDESGVERLLSYWGGEAVYRFFERDAGVSVALRRLGTACIVEAEIPITGIHTFMDVEERVLRCYLHHRGISTGHDPEMEGYVTDPVPPERIRGVIRASDARFDELTHGASWQSPPS